MYSTNTAIIRSEETVGKFMPVGINNDITLSEVNVKKSPTGRDYLELVFKNDNDQIVSMTEWKNEKNMWIKTDEELQKRDDQQFGKILQIMNCFYPNGVGEVSINSFVEMINWVKDKLQQSVTDKVKLRLKVIYDKNGYTTVSSNGIFIEPMSIAYENSQIKLFKRDTLERTIVADKESTDPLAADNKAFAPVTESSDDDLPF